MATEADGGVAERAGQSDKREEGSQMGPVPDVSANSGPDPQGPRCDCRFDEKSEGCDGARCNVDRTSYHTSLAAKKCARMQSQTLCAGREPFHGGDTSELGYCEAQMGRRYPSSESSLSSGGGSRKSWSPSSAISCMASRLVSGLVHRASCRPRACGLVNKWSHRRHWRKVFVFVIRSSLFDWFDDSTRAIPIRETRELA